MRPVLLLLLLAPCLLVLACARGSDTPANEPAGSPADAVEALYAAVEAGDCQAALSVLTSAYRPEIEAAGCDELMEKMREFPLDRILETKPDGRDPGARLVRTRIHQRQSDVIIRVQAENGAWKIAAM